MVKQVIVVRTDLNMRKGKISAQSCHASLAVFLNNEIFIDDNFLIIKLWNYAKEWIHNSFVKIIVGIESKEKLLSLYEKVKESGIPVSLIEDNGTTEFHGIKTLTCIAIGPWNSEEIDKFTGELKLL